MATVHTKPVKPTVVIELSLDDAKVLLQALQETAVLTRLYQNLHEYLKDQP
jgi:hypothetical protein